jgi:hypothetical protein
MTPSYPSAGSRTQSYRSGRTTHTHTTSNPFPGPRPRRTGTPLDISNLRAAPRYQAASDTEPATGLWNGQADDEPEVPVELGGASQAQEIDSLPVLE